MRRLAVFLMALAFLPGPVLAGQTGVEYTGYFEDTLSVEENKTQEKNLISNQSRVRLNLSGNYESRGDFNVALVGNGYSGNTTVNLVDYLPESVAAGIPFPIEYQLEDDIWLQEAYGSLYLGDFTFRIGRQKYYTGTGYAWNPTDLFNWKNVLDPTYETEGLDSIYLDYSFSEDIGAAVFYSFGTSHNKQEREYRSLEDGDYQIKFKTRFGNWEVAPVYSEVKRDFNDYEAVLAGLVAPADMTRQVKWQLSAIEISGEILGMGVHAEGGYAKLTPDKDTEQLPDSLKDHQKYLIGCDYTFENGLFLMMEYYHEGLGTTSANEYTLNQRLAGLTGGINSPGRDNLFLGGNYPVTDLTTLELYAIANSSDSSVIINPWLTWIAADDIQVVLSAQIPQGEEKTSLGRTGTTVFGRINFSF